MSRAGASRLLENLYGDTIMLCGRLKIFYYALWTRMAASNGISTACESSMSGAIARVGGRSAQCWRCGGKARNAKSILFGSVRHRSEVSPGARLQTGSRPRSRMILRRLDG